MTNAQTEARALWLAATREEICNDGDAISVIATALAAKDAELAAVKRDRAELALCAIAEEKAKTRALGRAEAAEAQLAEARKALDLFEHYGCPVCHGDCSSANPPVYCCPMEAARRALTGGQEDG